MEELLLAGKADMGIKIPPDFSSRIRRGETAAVQILADGSMSNMASVRISYAMMVLDRLNQQLLQELYGRDLKYGRIDARIRTWYNPNLDSQNFFVPGIVAFVDHADLAAADLDRHHQGDGRRDDGAAHRDARSSRSS